MELYETADQLSPFKVTCITCLEYLDHLCITDANSIPETFRVWFLAWRYAPMFNIITKDIYIVIQTQEDLFLVEIPLISTSQ